MDSKLGIKSELPIENISINTPKTTKEKYLEQTIDTKINNLEEIKSSSIIDINFQNDSHKESESITERITYNISGIKSEFTTVEFSDSMTTIASGTYKEKRTIKISEFEIDKTDIFFIDELTTNVNIETEFKSDLFKNISDSVVIINCKPGYFLPEGNNKECKPCSEIGCEICHGDISFDYCDSCFSNYIPKYIHNYLKCEEPDINCAEFDNKTYECLRCKDEYVLNEGKCYAYSFSGLYHTNENNKRVKLITLDKNYIEKIIVENETVNATNPSTFIDIQKSGDHQVYFLLTNNPKSLSSLFEGCNDIVSVSFSSKIKTENITNLSNMFSSCTYLVSVELSNLDTSNVINMDNMFFNCQNLGLINLQNFKTSNVITMNGMFRNCNSLRSLNLVNFNAQRIESFSYMFYFCSSLTSLILPYFPLMIGGEHSLKYTNHMFFYCESLTSINLTKLDFSKVIDMSSMFEGCSSLKEFHIPYIGRSNALGFINLKTFIINANSVLSMNNMFQDCTSLKIINISNWKLNNVQNMSSVFKNCYSLETVILGEFNSSKIINMDYLFTNCTSLEGVNLTFFKGTSNLVDMSHMFKDCSSLKEIDLSAFDMANVNNIQYMFSGCKALKTVNFNSQNQNKIKYMNSLFFGCSSLRNIIDMSRMFYNCSSISYLNLNSFDTSNGVLLGNIFPSLVL